MMSSTAAALKPKPDCMCRCSIRVLQLIETVGIISYSRVMRAAILWNCLECNHLVPFLKHIWYTTRHGEERELQRHGRVRPGAMERAGYLRRNSVGDIQQAELASAHDKARQVLHETRACGRERRRLRRLHSLDAGDGRGDDGDREVRHPDRTRQHHRPAARGSLRTGALWRAAASRYTRRSRTRGWRKRSGGLLMGLPSPTS